MTTGVCLQMKFLRKSDDVDLAVRLQKTKSEEISDSITWHRLHHK